MTKTTQWKPSDMSQAKPLCGMSVIEFQDEKREWHDFEVLKTPERLVFGGSCNVGFLESGYIERDCSETLDECLTELLADLEAYYNEGPECVSRIVCNERM